jgi:hypothetical protein
MTIRARLCLGLLLVGSTSFATPLIATEEAHQERPAGQPTPAVEGKQGEPTSNGPQAPAVPTDQPLRAVDTHPTSWSNVKALWG